MKIQNNIYYWIIFLVFVLMLEMAAALDYTFIWTGETDSSWWKTGNWSLNGNTSTAVPTETGYYNANVKVGKEVFSHPLIMTAHPTDSSYQTRLVDFNIGGGSQADPVIVDIEDCNIRMQSDFRQNFGSGTQCSIINMYGGTIETDTGAFMINCDGNSDFGYATFNMTGGYIKVSNWWFDTYQEQYKPGETWINISGGRIDTRGLFIGERGQSTMTVSGTAVINCDELFIKGYNASYNGYVEPELIVDSDVPADTPCISTDCLSLHQDAGSDLASGEGTAVLTIHKGTVVSTGEMRFGNIGSASLNMTGGKLEIGSNINCGINTANGNAGYTIRAYLSGGELWADDIVDYGNGEMKIFLSNDAAIYLRKPNSVMIQGYIDNGSITGLNKNDQVHFVAGWPVPRIVVRNNDLYASNPNYGYGQKNVPVDTKLTWESAPGAVRHHVYLGTSPSAVQEAESSSAEYRGAQMQALFAPLDTGHLWSSTTYYWRVDEEFGSGEVVKGSIWFFSTPTCNHPVDADGDCDVNLYDFSEIAENWLQNNTLGDSGWQRLELLAQQWLQPGPVFDPYPSQLVAYWRFDEHTGSYATDSVSGARDSISRGYYVVSWRKGVVGNALDLDGSFTYMLRFPNKVPVLTDEFTIEGWFGVRSWPVNDTQDSSDFASFVSCYNSSDGLRFGLNKFGDWGIKIGQNGQWNEYWASDKIPMMQWNHLAVTFNRNGSMKLYRNGNQVGSWPAVNVPFNLPESPLLIGIGNVITYAYGNSNFPNIFFNGLVDELKIFHRELRSDEISKSYSDTRPAISNLADIEVDTDRFANDGDRPRYHAMPPANWTNEMNGLIYYQGRYHLFYQANPNGVFIQHQRWGHLVSDDLIHWTPLPLILSPESNSSIDRWGCWAGSVVKNNNQLKLIYTPVDGSVARVGMATMNNNGISATKYSGNPVIGYIGSDSLYKDFRDPFVWQDGSYWYLIIGSGIKAGGGTALLCRSSDLVNWTYLKPILSDNFSAFWETPVMAYLGDDKYLLYASKCDPFTSSYWIGTWENETFTPDNAEPKHLDPFEKYCSSHNHQIGVSPCIDEEGRITTIHIINDCRSDSQQFEAGWAHNFSLPRVWYLRDDNTLGQKPHPALEMLRGDHLINSANIRVYTAGTVGLSEISGDMLEIKMTVSMPLASAFGMKLRRSPDEAENTVVKYQKDTNRIVFDLSNSSLDSNVFRGTEQGDFFLNSNEDLQLRIFIDKSMIEIFVNDREVFTARVYPTREDSQLVEFFSEGGSAIIKQIDVWEINP